MNFYDSNWINTDGNWIHKTAIIGDTVTLGKGNVIGPYCVIGSNGEMRGKDQGEFKGRVVIGDNNTISELVTIQRPFDEGKQTYIGSDNIIMAHCHIGHDAFIMDDCELSTSVIIGGHCKIWPGVRIKLGAIIRNRKQV